MLGRTDNVKTVYPPQTKFAGGIKMVFKTGYRLMQVQGEHSAILLTFIKLPFVIKIFVLSIFERPFYTGSTVNKAETTGTSPNFTVCHNQPLKRQSRLQQRTNFATFSLIYEKIKYDIS